MSEIQEDVMKQKIKEWKELHQDPLRELDFDMMLTVLRFMNASSVVKVARNPLDKDRNWNSHAITHNVKSLSVDDQGRLTLHLRHDSGEFTVEKFALSARKLQKRVAGISSPIMVQLTETKSVQITDVYSHALVRDNWAGLPFDLVFAYFEDEDTDE